MRNNSRILECVRKSGRDSYENINDVSYVKIKGREILICEDLKQHVNVEICHDLNEGISFDIWLK
jgi:hypothetical protein